MKSITEYIFESTSSSIINKIKKEFKTKFDNKVTIGSGKTNYEQLYDVYVYDDSLDLLKEVNDIIKKHISVWKEFSDDELKKKIDDHSKFLQNYNETLDNYPIEFTRFSSRELNKLK